MKRIDGCIILKTEKDKNEFELRINEINIYSLINRNLYFNIQKFTPESNKFAKHVCEVPNNLCVVENFDIFADSIDSFDLIVDPRVSKVTIDKIVLMGFEDEKTGLYINVNKNTSIKYHGKVEFSPDKNGLKRIESMYIHDFNHSKILNPSSENKAPEVVVCSKLPESHIVTIGKVVKVFCHKNPKQEI